MLFVFLFVIGFVAAALQCTIGFGSAVIMINVLPFFLDTRQTVAVSLFVCTLFPLYVIWKLRKKVRKDVFMPFLLPSLVCTVVATHFSTRIETSTMKVLLGFVFILLSVYFSFVAERIRIKPTKRNGILVGSLCGTLGGLFVAGGPPAVLYFAPALPDKEEYVATIQVYFWIINVVSLLTRVFSSAVLVADLKYMIITSLGAILGVVVGMKGMGQIEGILLKRFIYAFVGINGLVMVLSGLS